MDSFRIMFLRDRSGAPVGCVAMSFGAMSREMQFQVSTLNPVDDFDRKVARQLALGRLVETPFFIQLPKRTTVHEASVLVMQSIATSKTFPDRAVKAAKRWLRKQRGLDKTAE